VLQVCFSKCVMQIIETFSTAHAANVWLALAGCRFVAETRAGGLYRQEETYQWFLLKQYKDKWEIQKPTKIEL
jgi:hypothetical protein